MELLYLLVGELFYLRRVSFSPVNLLVRNAFSSPLFSSKALTTLQNRSKRRRNREERFVKP